MPPLISCIIPAYNMPTRQDALEEAIESFLRQDYPNKELIVFNDHAHQKLVLRHPQIKVINANRRSRTLGQKLNIGICSSSGEFICRFDDDDISLPWRLSFQLNALLEAGVDYYTTGSIWYREPRLMQWQKQTGYGHTQGMFRRSAFDVVGGYPAVSGNEDASLHGLLISKTSHIMGNETREQASYIYRWGEGLDHLSGHGTLAGQVYARYDKVGTPGTYELKPHWNVDYVRECQGNFVVTRDNEINSSRHPAKTETKLCVVGFPSKYGGADTELDHQITVWRSMGVDVSLIPTNPLDASQLQLGVAERGCTIHEPQDWSKATGRHVISYCNGQFLAALGEIRKYARSTTFVNCMTWLFDNEKAAHQRGWIDFFLYQTDHAREKIQGALTAINPKFCWHKVRPYFDATGFPWVEDRDDSVFSFCRVSRDDFHKYGTNQFLIYDAIRAPVPKRGQVLGITDRIFTKCGQPPSFVKCWHPGEVPPQQVYRESHCLIQNCDTYENLPRVAMEAMSMGCIPIVDNRGGWTEIVTHGETGFLCSNSNEFVEAAETLANDRELRQAMSTAARERVLGLYGAGVAAVEWQQFFDRLNGFAPEVIIESRQSGSGKVGAELKKLLSWFGQYQTETCPCNHHAMAMDRNGVQWCEKNIPTICGWLKDEAQKRRVLGFSLDRVPGFGLSASQVVQHAIRRAKREGQ